jgi:hypothetical protein
MKIARPEGGRGFEQFPAMVKRSDTKPLVTADSSATHVIIMYRYLMRHVPLECTVHEISASVLGYIVDIFLTSPTVTEVVISCSDEVSLDEQCVYFKQTAARRRHQCAVRNSLSLFLRNSVFLSKFFKVLAF